MKDEERSTTREMIIHPGETLKEVMEDRNITVKELAKSTGFTHKYINAVLNSEENISNDFARELENTLNIEADFWMKLNKLFNHELKTFEGSIQHNILENTKNIDRLK